MVSVPLVGTLPTGGAGNLAGMSAMSGQSMEDLRAQCEITAQMAVDPAQPEAMRTNMVQSAQMMGCPG